MIAPKMTAAITRRHILLATLVFLIVSIIVWSDSILPRVTEHLPGIDKAKSVLQNPLDSTNPPESTQAPDSTQTHDNTQTHEGDIVPDNTKHRYYSSTDGGELSGVTKMERPPNVKKVMGLIFHGRRTTVSILDCYLKRNLVKNGGILDGVIFLARTEDKADLALLDKLVATEPDYERWDVDLKSDRGYATSYDRIDDDVMYIKIDDDIVFIEDTVIPSLVQTKVSRPDYYAVSANVVNSPLISWIHYNLGAVKPYLPELNKEYPKNHKGKDFDWRTSPLPAWEGPDDFDVSNFSSPDGKKHRWLPVKGREDHILDGTPINVTEYHSHGKGWWMWQIGAQEHYSFLDNLEKNELWRYKFHSWDFQYLRMGIQFIAMMGRDINLAKPIASDDEQHFAVTMPERLGRHAVADGRGTVAHYSFFTQIEGMRSTDILNRYRAYAKENICAGPMLWESEADD